MPTLFGIFVAMTAGYFITWPIVALDTDLWYHLSGGRYLWQNGSIANKAFFSYIDPQKLWYNYYWMFQAIVFPIHKYSGYYGLIVFRCLLYLLTVLFIFFFFSRQDNERKGWIFSLSFFICYPILLIGRELNVRPHLFSYLFVVAFLYILERKRDKAWLLPLIGVLWCNIHGIEFPVMFLIIIAYLTETYYKDWRNRALRSGGNKKTKWLMIGTLYTVFLTPGFVELIKAPFSITY
ncbi:MAG: hypothetical protein L7F78_11635, partial [Syntrophales bacterium LBB04]|nr:hypothetical protein [Syntrophales bacterium LBB04]